MKPRRPLVLIVDDSEKNRKLARDVLGAAGIATLEAATGMDAIALAGDSSRTTHGARTAVDACRYFAGLLVGALRGVSKDALLAGRYEPAPGCWDDPPLAPEVDAVAHGSFRRKNPPEIRGTGYVVACLEAALWALHHSRTFAEGCLLAVNLGDDADTTGAVYGQLAGALYGEGAIPPEWRDGLALRDTIETLADRLCEAAWP